MKQSSQQIFSGAAPLALVGTTEVYYASDAAHFCGHTEERLKMRRHILRNLEEIVYKKGGKEQVLLQSTACD